METLWSGAEAMSAREVSRSLADRDLAYTTVMTVLDRLAKKSVVTRERDGRAWRYRPAARREDYIAELMQGALDLTGDRSAALVRFVQTVSDDEVAVLRDVLAELDGRDQ
jgi:predicted transcriptional regulator